MHRYQLQPYKGAHSRHQCPACGKPRQFTLYIDTETGETLAPYVGKCNRLDKCGHHYTPKQYFADEGNNMPVGRLSPSPQKIQKQPTYIPPATVENSFKHFNNNHFVSYLNRLFGFEITYTLLKTYPVGTSKHWPGATVFWQVDAQGNVRTGKIMLYNPATGKRVKEPHNCITWAHSVIKQPDFNLKQCLFGEHLINSYPDKPIAIVESEKTAIIASLYYPQYLWLAVGNLADLNPEKCQAIANKQVILLPDLKGYEKWKEKAAKISPRWQVSKFIETYATETEKEQGLDIADYLLRFPPHQSVEPSPQKEIPPQPTLSNTEILAEIEAQFAAIDLPETPLKISPCETVLRPAKFIQSHLEILHGNEGNPTFLPYLHRLQKLKQTLYGVIK